MGQLTEDFVRKMLIDARDRKHTPLTCWEQEQLAWAWCKYHGHDVADLDQVRRPSTVTRDP